MNRTVLLLALATGCGGSSSAVVDTMPAVSLGEAEADSHPASEAVRRAEVLIGGNQIADAVPLLETAVRDNPRDARAFMTLGIARSLLSDVAGAEAALRSALGIDPDYPEAWNELGLAFRDGGRLPDAIGALRRAVDLRPEFHDAWYNLALAQEDANELDAAEQSYVRAIEGLGDDPVVRLHHAGLALRRGDRERGIVELRRARGLATGQIDVLRVVARTFSELGEAAEAADTLVPAVNAERQPSLSALVEAAGLARSARRVDVSVGLARRATELHPLAARAFAMLALVESDAGHATEARAALDRAVRLDTDGALREELERLRARLSAP